MQYSAVVAGQAELRKARDHIARRSHSPFVFVADGRTHTAAECEACAATRDTQGDSQTALHALQWIALARKLTPQIYLEESSLYALFGQPWAVELALVVPC